MSQSENEVLEYTANVLFSSSESEGEFSGFEADSAEPKQCQQRKLKSVVKRVHKSSTRTDVNNNSKNDSKQTKGKQKATKKTTPKNVATISVVNPTQSSAQGKRLKGIKKSE